MNKKLIISVTLGITVLIVVSVALLFWPRNQLVNKTNDNDSNAIPTSSTPELKFVVVRVLPSGFSPKEVTIEKGMIVRFTNPLDEKASIKWDGDQYTSDQVYNGNDISTKVFDKEGEYNYTSDSGGNGKVIVR